LTSRHANLKLEVLAERPPPKPRNGLPARRTMPITILGMPRGGTLFVMDVLRCHGVAIAAGPSASCPDAGSPSGFRQINERLLARHGGGWDAPPELPEGWESGPGMDSLRSAAEELVSRVASREPWAWADPVGAFTLPFWTSITDGVKPLVVIRNPLEVIVSQHAKTTCSLPFAVDLIRRYLRAILRTTTPAGRVVTHYAAYASDARAEANRVLAALGCPTASTAADWRGYRPSLRHARFSLEQLRAFTLPTDIIEMYETLYAEAGFCDDRDGGDGITLDPDSLGWLRANLLEQAGAVPPASGSRAVDALTATVHELRADLARLRGELAIRDDSVQEVLDDLRFIQTHLQVPSKQLRYRQTVRRARQLVDRHVPKQGIVAVISKGDDDLLRYRDRQGWHFPCDERGTYSGWYPACDLAAIAHLETLRARGATHLLVPETYAWWLTTYPDFRRHLDRHATLVEEQAGTGMLYSLAAKVKNAQTDMPLAETMERLTDGLGRPPQVLDLMGGSQAGEWFSDSIVFSPPPSAVGAPRAKLPYVDSSIDIVAVASPKPPLLAEARRVASLAVIDCSKTPRVEWLREPPARQLPSVSIIVPVFNQWPITRGCLEAVWATVPRDQNIEVIVSDDASTDETARALAAMAMTEPRLKVLRNEKNCGFVESCNRAAAAATGDILVFLNNDTVPLPGWLEPLIRTFSLFPNVGAVGGKLLSPDGSLQEAGGIIFADGSACHFGRGEANAMKPLFDYVRQVDYVSGALLATPRKLFADLGGFDPDFAPGYYEDTDYCFRLREQRYGIYYQPEAVIVHLEGATAGTDHATGMKRYQEINRKRFRVRHAAALREQRRRPDSLGADSWAELAHRWRGRVDA